MSRVSLSRSFTAWEFAPPAIAHVAEPRLPLESQSGHTHLDLRRTPLASGIAATDLRGLL